MTRILTWIIGLLLFPSMVMGLDIDALTAISKMLNSLNHVRTLECSVTVTQRTGLKLSTLNYTLYADQYDQKAAVVGFPFQQTYIQNKKGIYTIRKGDAVKQPRQVAFPFDVPSQFLSRLKLKDVTDNYTFVTHEKSESQWIIDMIPVGTGGGSIQESYSKNSVTMIRFTLSLPRYTMATVEIFKNNSTVATDYVEAEYDIIRNKVIDQKGFFKNTYRESDVLMLTHTRSVSNLGKDQNSRPKTQIKDCFYSKIVINEVIDPKVFDEENY